LSAIIDQKQSAQLEIASMWLWEEEALRDAKKAVSDVAETRERRKSTIFREGAKSDHCRIGKFAAFCKE
jgi:hypothetical protein